MVANKSPNQQERENTREALLEAAVRVFAQHGFEGATVRAIAEAAGVNISAINYHFKGKEGLYRACLESFAEAGEETMGNILRPASSASDFRLRLQIFVESFFMMHAKHDLIDAILNRDFPDANPTATQVFLSSFAPKLRMLEAYFLAARDGGFLAASVNPQVSVMMLMATLSNYKRFDRARQLSGLPMLFSQESLPTTIAEIVAQCCDGTMMRVA